MGLSDNGVKTSATNAATTAQGQSATAYNTAAPIFQQMATNPQGYTPQQQADMVTASGQTLGGGVAAATGLGALMAARTGNAGAASAAIADATRSSQVTQSQNNLNIQQQSADIARQQRAQGLAGLTGIYQDANGTAVSNLNTANQAAKPLWQQMLLSGISGAAAGAAGH